MDFSMMPTAAKLVASIFFAALGFMAASLVIPYLPEGNSPKNLGYFCALIGFLTGYRWSGRNAGLGWRAGFGYGLTTVFLMALYILFLLAAKETYVLSTQLRYDGVLDALKGCVGTMVDYGRYLLNWDVIALLVVGAMFGGWLTERTARVWS
jgi:hypothetical protein